MQLGLKKPRPVHRQLIPRSRPNTREMPKKRSFTHRVSRFFGLNQTSPPEYSSPGIELTNLRDRRDLPLQNPLYQDGPFDKYDNAPKGHIELTMDMIRSMSREEKIQKLKELFDFPNRYFDMIKDFNRKYDAYFQYFSNPLVLQCLTDNQLGYVLIDIMLQYDRTHNYEEFKKVKAEVENFDPVIYVRSENSRTWFQSYNTEWAKYQHPYGGVQKINMLSGPTMGTIVSALENYVGREKLTKDTMIPLTMKACEALAPLVAGMPDSYNEAFHLYL